MGAPVAMGFCASEVAQVAYPKAAESRQYIKPSAISSADWLGWAAASLSLSLEYPLPTLDSILFPTDMVPQDKNQWRIKNFLD